MGDFIRYVEDDLDRMMEYGQAYAEPILKNKDEIKQWIKSHLPYTLKALVPVTRYFIEKYNSMPVAPWYDCGKDGRLALK